MNFNKLLQYWAMTTTLGCAFFPLGMHAADADSSADKSQFTVFNRTPNESMRALSSDQMTGITTPFTVDAGHFQIEANLIDVNLINQFRTFVFSDPNS